MLTCWHAVALGQSAPERMCMPERICSAFMLPAPKADMHMQHFICLHIYADKAYCRVMHQGHMLGMTDILCMSSTLTARVRVRNSSV